MTHHGKNSDKYIDIDTDHQLKKVRNFFIQNLIQMIILSQGSRIC